MLAAFETPVRPVRRTPLPSSNTIKSIIGVAAYLAIWEVAGRRGWLGTTFPPLSDIFAEMTSEARRATILRAFRATTGAAAWGFLLGVAASLVGAALGLFAPPLRRGIDQLATIVHATPIIAVAPLFIVTIGREGTPVAIAALAAGFAMFVAATSAFQAASPIQQDVFTALGSGRIRRFLSLQLPASIPGLLDGLRMAAPAALLGAVLGEWFGAPRGLGVLIVSAMQNYQIDLLWAAALLTALVSMVAFGLLSLAARASAKRWSS
jgi:ABC-type nitrate/sulfonate/bicarbonate transport system permease component